MAGEADNSEYWDALAQGIEREWAKSVSKGRPAVPRFGGYVAVPRNHGDADLYAWRSDGKLAKYRLWFGENGHWHEDWVPCLAPDFDKLFPASPSAPEIAQAWDARVEAARDAMPFRGDLPDQPRPDDADDTEYPRTRRGRDD